MFRFQFRYAIITLIIFVIEVIIALYFHDRFIRPYFGDLLVVILMYSFIRSFIKAPVLSIAIPVLIFSYAVEVLQYFHLVKLLGLERYPLAWIILGSSFEPLDLVAYTAGIIFIILIERNRLRGNSKLNDSIEVIR